VAGPRFYNWLLHAFLPWKFLLIKYHKLVSDSKSATYIFLVLVFSAVLSKVRHTGLQVTTLFFCEIQVRTILTFRFSKMQQPFFDRGSLTRIAITRRIIDSSACLWYGWKANMPAVFMGFTAAFIDNYWLS
jgi:hypothetical protein